MWFLTLSLIQELTFLFLRDVSKGNFTILLVSAVYCFLFASWFKILKCLSVSNQSSSVFIFFLQYVFYQVFSIYLSIVIRNSGAKYRFFIIWFSSVQIISHYFLCYLLYNLISPGNLKRNIFFSLDKTVPVTTAFDLKGTILCLCSNARRGVIKSDLVLGERKQRPG